MPELYHQQYLPTPFSQNPFKCPRRRKTQPGRFGEVDQFHPHGSPPPLALQVDERDPEFYDVPLL